MNERVMDYMDWEHKLSSYEGKLISIWIEDQSGEEQTKPKTYTLNKVEMESEALKFYISPTQFLVVPLFGEEQTKLVNTASEVYFVSHDVDSKLVYRVYFAVI